MKHMHQYKTHIIGGLAAMAIFFLGGIFMAPAEAQAACQVSSPSFSPDGEGGKSIMGLNAAAPWYTDANPPTLGFSVSVSDCAGQNIKVEVLSAGVSQGSFSTLVPSSSSGNGTLNASITVGEEQCSGNTSPNCRLSLRATSSGQTLLDTSTSGNYQVKTAGILGYNCDAFCSEFFGSVNFSPPNWGSATTPGDGGAGVDFSRLENPIQYDNIPDVIKQLLTIVFVIGIPLVAFAIIYAGFLLVTAGGSQDKLKKGKQALLAGVIGGAILLGAWVIAEAIQGTVDQIRGV